MKLTKGKKIALTYFGVFLGFMAVCTVAAKGIYTSGLPKVTVTKPFRTSLTHSVNVNATVRQGQEYGIYAETGLRVDTVSVGNGDLFQAGQELFRVETEDLADQIAEHRLELAKLEAQQAEALKTNSHDKKDQQTGVARARENYDTAVLAADAQIERCLQDLEAARAELALYEQYLTDSAEGTDKDNIGEGGERPGENTDPGEWPGGNIWGKPVGPGIGKGSLAETPEEASGETPGENPAPENAVKTLEESGENPEEASGETPEENPAPENAVKTLEESGENPEEASGETPEENPAPENAGEASEENSAGSPPESTGSGTPGEPGETGSGKLQEVAGEETDYEQEYIRQEKRLQLEQRVMACQQALEEAQRQKETALLEAARTMEDAESVRSPDASAVNILSLDIGYRKEKLERLEQLAQAEGRVYAEGNGIVVDCRLRVGERIPDGAVILYALDDGERVLNTVFYKEQQEYISVGTQFDMEVFLPDGSRQTGTALLEYLEEGEESLLGELSFDLQQTRIGQSAQLSCKLQTDVFETVVQKTCIYDGPGETHYLFVAEEHQGILGTEWRVRKVKITVEDQNETMAAVSSAELTSESRVVAGSDKQLLDGAVVRVVN